MAFNIFGPTCDLLSKVLDLRSQRHSVISSNIANAETPNYKAKRFQFEDELRKVMPRKDKLPLATTDKNHMPNQGDLGAMRPKLEQDSIQFERADGNTVDLEREMVGMSKNHVMYNAVSQIMSKKLRGLKNIIREVK